MWGIVPRLWRMYPLNPLLDPLVVHFRLVQLLLRLGLLGQELVHLGTHFRFTSLLLPSTGNTKGTGFDQCPLRCLWRMVLIKISI